MGRVCRGAMVRALYALCIALMTGLVVVMYEGRMTISGSWAFALGIIALIVEGIVTNKMTQGFDWKWINPATVLFTANALAVVWFLQLRALSYTNQGLQACTNYTSTQELTKIDLSVASDWMNFCACGHCNGAAEQFFVIMLLIGRYFLPKGISFYHPENDKINIFLKSIARTHFFLVITCNGADALDMLSYSRYPTVQGNTQVISMLLILFSAGVSQFCIDTLATTETKSADFHIIVETDLWSSLVILIINDLPYLAMRLFLMTKYQVFSSMGVYFFFKNFVCMCVTLHKGIMIWFGKDMDEIEDYVTSEPYTPEPTKRLMSRMDTPDSLDGISDSESLYSNEQAVKSRAERNPPRQKEGWGDEAEWFDDSKANIDKKTLVDAKSNGGSQFIASADWDVEAGEVEDLRPAIANEKLDIWNPRADPAYFTENYADECDAMLDMSKVGGRSEIHVPLGVISMKGPINFSMALPKPEPRYIDSAKSEKKHKKRKDEPADDWDDDDKKTKSKAKESDEIDDDIDDIINAVDDDEHQKEKKKKKKKDKDRERDKEEEEEETPPTKSEDKKHKKKKSKSDDLERVVEEDEPRKDKHKKKKKSKDKDKDN